MMKAQLKFDCKNCIDDITIDVTTNGKTMTSLKEIRDAARKQSWSIGRDCYCPTCSKALPASCSTCEHFEGNKSMGSSICRIDGNFTTASDYCTHHEPRHGYKNPIPSLD